MSGSDNVAGDYNQQLWAPELQQLMRQMMQPGGIVMNDTMPQLQAPPPAFHPLVSAREIRVTLVEEDRARWRALRLLWKHLTPGQRHQLREKSRADHVPRSFIVQGNASGNHFRIFSNGEVLRLVDQHRFCLVVGVDEPGLPIYDVLLAKKLLLENDEYLFLRVANDLNDPMLIFGRLQEAQRRAERTPPEPPTTDGTGRRGRAWRNRLRLW